jgi:8-oxo-dGTP diphosphatase
MSEVHTSPLVAGPFLQNLEVRVVVFSLRNDRLQVLLAPSRDEWALPGNRVPVQQSLEATATDTLLCLTGLREAYLEQLYTYGESAHSPGVERLVTVVYFAIIPAGAAHIHATSSDKDDCRAKWFPVDDLRLLILDHREILAYALRRLRYKLEYTAVGFQLLPEHFSLSELQKVYEMILGEKLDKRNFRRRILQAGIIEETQHLRAGEGRPARLFRYRPDAVAEVKVRRLFP